MYIILLKHLGVMKGWNNINLLEFTIQKCDKLELKVNPYDIVSFSCPDKLMDGVDDLCYGHGDQSLFCNRCWKREINKFDNLIVNDDKFIKGIKELQLFLKSLRQE